MISRDITVTIKQGNATMKEPLTIYEGDYGIEFSFTLLKFQYKFANTAENIISTLNEDVLEAYTTIVNPQGDELSQQNGEVIDNTIKFTVTKDMTDELTEIGTYQLQFHLICKHSEISVPPISFEVKERLKGLKDFVEAIVGTGVVGRCKIEHE